MSKIVRSITHWTGGGGRASALDKKHYHRITEHDGKIVPGNEKIEDNIVTSDGDYAAHTLNLNTGSAGMAMAGMAGAKESPFDPGPSPITQVQFEAHCRMLAEFHTGYAIPVTRETCLTHAEVEPVLGVRQRGKWDITRLVFRNDLRGAIAIGDYMRERVRAYQGATAPAPDDNRPVLRQGDRGVFVLDLQALLKAAGYMVGKVDGKFGRLTRAAVVAFQDAHGLSVDGVVGRRTWAALQVADRRPERDVTARDLRERGSETVKAADRGEIVTGVAAGGLTLDTALKAVREAPAALTDAESVLGMTQGLVTEYWPTLLLAGGAVAGFLFFRRIKTARVKDARLGRNLAR